MVIIMYVYECMYVCVCVCVWTWDILCSQPPTDPWDCVSMSHMLWPVCHAVLCFGGQEAPIKQWQGPWVLVLSGTGICFPMLCLPQCNQSQRHGGPSTPFSPTPALRRQRRHTAQWLQITATTHLCPHWHS